MDANGLPCLQSILVQMPTMTNGAKMQTLYSRIATAAKNFHVNNKTATSLTVDCSDLGFKTTDAYVKLAFSRFVYDNPLYYWLSGGYSYKYYSSNNVITSVVISIVPEYSDGSVRAKYNSKIYVGAEEYYSVVENEESEYNITLAYIIFLNVFFIFCHRFLCNKLIPCDCLTFASKCAC